MTPLSQILALVEDYKNLSSEFDQLTQRLQAGDIPVEVDVLFTEGSYRTKLMLSTIVTEVDNARKMVMNSLMAIGIDVNA